jgi:hypothetical protein
MAVTIRFIHHIFKKVLEVISFGLQQHVTSYICVVHYMSMFCWAYQLNYTAQKATALHNAHSQNGK